MMLEITVSYPWATVPEDKVIIELDKNTPEKEKEIICFNYALDLIFDRGVSWDYKEIKEV